MPTCREECKCELHQIHAAASDDPTFTYAKYERTFICEHPFDDCSILDLLGGEHVCHCSVCGALWTTVGGEWHLPAWTSRKDVQAKIVDMRMGQRKVRLDDPRAKTEGTMLGAAFRYRELAYDANGGRRDESWDVLGL